ncbi:hypothetical protein PTKIN_Ptkin16aG0115800 [Pterospermum kingtungense]
MTIDFNHFYYGSNLQNLTIFYGCNLPSMLEFILPKKCTINGTIIDVLYSSISLPLDLFPRICHESVIVPIYEKAALNLVLHPLSVNHALKEGFQLKWKVDNDQCRKCEDSDGVFGCNQTTNSFICFYSPTHGSAFMINMKWKVTIGIVPGTVAISAAILCLLRSIWKKTLREKQNVKAFIKTHGSFAPKRYSYSEVKKMTKTFQHKLGQGGYGSVYRGKLPNGHLIAVKLLFLVFVIMVPKRALIYDYMPNGSLDRFIYENNRLKTGSNLEWRTLYQITLGIARGLEYLHQGCSTRILHFDIKPHNILLDEEFNPKISDFGLAKLCQRKESIVSVVGARGTAEYMAPELSKRSFGGVSFKSDVYSFGMMVLEMVGGRKNIDVAASNANEVYFPEWIYNSQEDDFSKSMVHSNQSFGSTIHD